MLLKIHLKYTESWDLNVNLISQKIFQNTSFVEVTKTWRILLSQQNGLKYEINYMVQVYLNYIYFKNNLEVYFQYIWNIIKRHCIWQIP